MKDESTDQDGGAEITRSWLGNRLISSVSERFDGEFERTLHGAVAKRATSQVSLVFASVTRQVPSDALLHICTSIAVYSNFPMDKVTKVNAYWSLPSLSESQYQFCTPVVVLCEKVRCRQDSSEKCQRGGDLGTNFGRLFVAAGEGR